MFSLKDIQHLIQLVKKKSCVDNFEELINKSSCTNLKNCCCDFQILDECENFDQDKLQIFKIGCTKKVFYFTVWPHKKGNILAKIKKVIFWPSTILRKKNRANDNFIFFFDKKK